MHGLLPFLGGAAIGVGLLSVFAPNHDVPIGDHPPALAQEAAGSVPSMDAGKTDRLAPDGTDSNTPGPGGMGDGSTGPTHPNANTADTSREMLREKRLEEQQKKRNDPLAPIPGAE